MPSPGSAVTLFGTGAFGKTAFAYFLQALEENGLVRMLAEPNVVAINGQEASFIAGGEFPVPVSQGGGSGAGAAVTVQYQEYGIRLNFTPLVLGNGSIRLKVAPEVSELDFANAVRSNGFLIPALTKRKVSTTVELADGQSFALAGLMNDTMSSTTDAVPLLGDVPVIGMLFRSTKYQRQQTELVVMVTPRLVGPTDPDRPPPCPASTGGTRPTPAPTSPGTWAGTSWSRARTGIKVPIRTSRRPSRPGRSTAPTGSPPTGPAAAAATGPPADSGRPRGGDGAVCDDRERASEQPMYVQLNCAIIDADATNLQELGGFLGQFGVNVVAAAATPDGLPALLGKQDAPQLVIVNLDPDAAETLKRIENLPRQYPAVSFFVMSQTMDARPADGGHAPRDEGVHPAADPRGRSSPPPSSGSGPSTAWASGPACSASCPRSAGAGRPASPATSPPCWPSTGPRPSWSTWT